MEIGMNDPENFFTRLTDAERDAIRRNQINHVADAMIRGYSPLGRSINADLPPESSPVPTYLDIKDENIGYRSLENQLKIMQTVERDRSYRQAA